MCGITGYVQTQEKLTSEQRNLTTYMIQLLLAQIESRGRDASGYAYVSPEASHPLMFKAPITSSELASGSYLENSLSTYFPKIFIGHARAGTAGTEDFNINNHPFVTHSGRMFLVHNGIVHDWTTKRDLDNKLIGDCDTEMIIRLIETYGIKETLETMSDWNWSSYALLIMDTHKEVLYLFRRSNPINYVHVPELGGLFIASEKQMLETSIRALDIKTKKLEYYVPKHEVLERLWAKNNILHEDHCGEYKSITHVHGYQTKNKNKKETQSKSKRYPQSTSTSNYSSSKSYSYQGGMYGV